MTRRFPQTHTRSAPDVHAELEARLILDRLEATAHIARYRAEIDRRATIAAQVRSDALQEAKRLLAAIETNWRHERKATHQSRFKGKP